MKLAGELDYERTIIEAAKAAGWLVHGERPAWNRHRTKISTPIKGHAGFPDLVLAHPRGGVWFIELKSDGARLTREQAEWGKTLRLAGATWRLVYVPDELDTFCQELADVTRSTT